MTANNQTYMQKGVEYENVAMDGSSHDSHQHYTLIQCVDHGFIRLVEDIILGQFDFGPLHR